MRGVDESRPLIVDELIVPRSARSSGPVGWWGCSEGPVAGIQGLAARCRASCCSADPAFRCTFVTFGANR